MGIFNRQQKWTIIGMVSIAGMAFTAVDCYAIISNQNNNNAFNQQYNYVTTLQDSEAMAQPMPQDDCQTFGPGYISILSAQGQPTKFYVAWASACESSENPGTAITYLGPGGGSNVVLAPYGFLFRTS